MFDDKEAVVGHPDRFVECKYAQIKIKIKISKLPVSRVIHGPRRRDILTETHIDYRIDSLLLDSDLYWR